MTDFTLLFGDVWGQKNSGKGSGEDDQKNHQSRKRVWHRYHSVSGAVCMDVKLVSSSQGEEAGVNYTMGKEENLIRTDELIIKNLKTNKVLQISQEIGKVPVLSFGNSSGDCSMHNYCLNNKYRSAAFMLVADDDTRDHANREKALSLASKWRDSGYHVISMRDDFRTIYGSGVQKVDFTFSE